MSQHMLPTWQTGLSSPSPHSLPSCSGSARPSVRPSMRAAGAPPCPAAAGLGPTQCHGRGGVSRRGRAAAPTVPACPSATTARARPGTGHGPRPAARQRRPGVSGDRQTCCSEPLTAQPGGCWLRSSQQKPAHRPPDPVWGRGALQSTGGGACPTVAHQRRHCGWLR